MVLDEFLDGSLWHAQRGTHCQAAIRLDDEGDCLSPGVDEMVDGDRHEQKYTKAEWSGYQGEIIWSFSQELYNKTIVLLCQQVVVLDML
jgi:hypothetical protein